MRDVKLSRYSATHVGDRIVALRRNRDWSTQDLATALGIAWSSCRRLEKGESLPSLGTLLGLVVAFELRSVEEVLGDGRLGTTVLLEIEDRRRKSGAPDAPENAAENQ